MAEATHSGIRLNDQQRLDAPRNKFGGLTLVPLPGYEAFSEMVASHIEAIGEKDARIRTPVDIAIPGFGCYANGETYPQLGKQHVGGHDCVVITSGPGTPVMRDRLNFTLDYLAGRRASRIAAVTGYFPMSRSDKDEGGMVFAAPPFVFRMMQAAARGKLDRLIAADLHAPQVVMAGQSGQITEVTLMRVLLAQAILDGSARLSDYSNIVLHFTDGGSLKRFRPQVERVEKDLDTSFAKVYGDKNRSSSTESEILALYGDVAALQGALVLSIDDEMATCGTLIDSADSLLRDYLAREVWSVVTHGVLCGKAIGRMRSPQWPLTRSYISDTIAVYNREQNPLEALMRSGKIRVVSWVEELAEIIYFHHWDENLREMR